MDRSVEEMLSNLEGAYSPNTLRAIVATPGCSIDSVWKTD